MIYLELDGQGDMGRQLVRALRNAIRSGRLATGARLPSSRELAGHLGIARNLVLYAYEVLAAERLIAGRVGAGTFVTSGVPARKITPHPTRLPAQSLYARRLRDLMDEPSSRVGSAWRHDFQYNVPLVDPGLFSAWARALAYAAERTEAAYPPAAGHPALREEIARHVALQRGIECSADDVIVVNGALQGLSLIASVLLDEGDRVAIEDPTLPALRLLLRARGIDVRPVPVDGDGLNVAEIPPLAPKAVLVHPSGQFPLGVPLAGYRQQRLLAYASEQPCWIIEFDQDSALLDPTDAASSLRGADHQGQVIFVGSFSRLLIPSLRLGYVVAPPSIRGDLLRAKALLDAASPAIEQMALSHFMSTGRLERHMHRARAELRRRRSALNDGVVQYCGRHVQLSPSRPSLHAVAWLPGWTTESVLQLREEAARRDIRLYPIDRCYERPAPVRGLLMGFAGLSPAQLELATKMLGEVLDTIPSGANQNLKRA